MARRVFGLGKLGPGVSATADTTARLTAESPTTPHAIVETAAYMSPDQADSRAQPAALRLKTTRLTGEGAARVTPVGVSAAFSPPWSPDGRFIACVARELRAVSQQLRVTQNT